MISNFNRSFVYFYQVLYVLFSANSFSSMDTSLACNSATEVYPQYLANSIIVRVISSLVFLALLLFYTPIAYTVSNNEKIGLQ